MKKLLSLILLIAVVCTGTVSMAQKKEKSVCAKADRMMDRGNYYEAVNFYKKVYNKKRRPAKRLKLQTKPENAI
ncbi:MAG: hypothetical protein IPP29_21390 [Bacteroidetes bacterium]|nr:hypothetical protein [Bacteroidota bacterium]